MKNIKTDEQLKKEMIKKVDIKKCKKFYAMCCDIREDQIKGFDRMLEEWANNKVHIYKLFGEQLKIANPINYTREEVLKVSKDTQDELLDDNNIRKQFVNFINDVSDEAPGFAVIGEYLSYDDIARTFPDVKKTDTWLGHNRTQRVFGNEQKMPLSTWIHKVFRSEYIDTEFSKLTQELSVKNISGTMYISIDPFDYLTMSVNKSNWESCLSLHNQMYSPGRHFGAYCAGTISYMCDKPTIVAYRTSGRDCKYEWGNRGIMAESKNWRQLIYLQEDFESFACCRQYPFNSEFLGKIIREMVEKQIDNKKEILETSTNSKKNNIKWKISRKSVENKHKIADIIMPGDRLFYDDITHGRDFVFAYKKPHADLKTIVVGSIPFCPICSSYPLRNSPIPFCVSCFDRMQRGG